MAYLCVEDEDGMALLVDELEAVATTTGMSFFDYSSEIERGLAVVGYAGRERDDGSPLIEVVVERFDGLSVSAGNVALPGFQIALGFTEGRDLLETKKFTDGVIYRLERHWQVDRLPAGTGVLPRPDCR